jgi:cytochrome c-type biogenesis protein CcmH/NrfG
MPLLYVFPNEADTFPVLRAAIAANPSDASAHFLLGELLISRGLADPAIAEWKIAESIDPKIPSLQLSMGRALFIAKKQLPDAAAELQRGLQTESANAALYLAMNDVMHQMGKTAAQRADMMRTFPDPANMPSDLTRVFVDTLREAGRNDEANAVLAGHFVPRKEGEQPQQLNGPSK